MKIEAGKYYRLRDGKKAYVIGRDLNADCSEVWVGSISMGTNVSRLYRWDEAGRMNGTTFDNTADIIEEFKEKHTFTLCLWKRNDTGELVVCLDNIEVLESRSLPQPTVLHLVSSRLVTFTEKEFVK